VQKIVIYQWWMVCGVSDRGWADSGGEGFAGWTQLRHPAQEVSWLQVLFPSSTPDKDHGSKALVFLIVLYVSSYGWVHFSWAVLFNQMSAAVLLRWTPLENLQARQGILRFRSEKRSNPKLKHFPTQLADMIWNLEAYVHMFRPKEWFTFRLVFKLKMLTFSHVYLRSWTDTVKRSTRTNQNSSLF